MKLMIQMEVSIFWLRATIITAFSYNRIRVINLILFHVTILFLSEMDYIDRGVAVKRILFRHCSYSSSCFEIKVSNLKI